MRPPLAEYLNTRTRCLTHELAKAEKQWTTPQLCYQLHNSSLVRPLSARYPEALPSWLPGPNQQTLSSASPTLTDGLQYRHKLPSWGMLVSYLPVENPKAIPKMSFPAMLRPQDLLISAVGSSSLSTASSINSGASSNFNIASRPSSRAASAPTVAPAFGSA